MWGFSKKAAKSNAAVQRNEPTHSAEPYRPGDLSADVLELQHSAGNQAVGRIVNSAENVPYGIPPGLHPTVQSILSNSAGRPLDERTLDSMEQAYDFDFSAVRIHTDPAAVESARILNAEAYTVGRHVVFDEGEYAPQNHSGRLVLAHELAHVIQQSRGGRSVPLRTPASPMERAAEQAANAAAHESGPVQVSGASAPTLALRARTPDQYRIVFQANRYWQRKLNIAKEQSSDAWPYIETLHNLWWSNDPDRDEGASDRFREFIDAVWEFQWAHRVELGNLEDGIVSGKANGELTPKTAALWRKLTAAPQKAPAAPPAANPRAARTPRHTPPPESRRTAQPTGLESVQQLAPTLPLGPAKIFRAKPSSVGAAPYPSFDYEALKEAIYKDIISGLRSAQKATFDKFRELAAKIPEPGKSAVETLIDVLEEIVGVFITIILYAIGLIVGFGTAIVQMIWGLSKLVHGFLKWIALWFYGLFVDNFRSYLKYTNEIITAVKQVPSGIKKLFNDWVEKFKKAPIDRGTLMIGELFGQIIAVIATFGATASKAGQMSKLTYTMEYPVRIGSEVIWQEAVVAVDVATPSAVAGYPVVFMTGHDVPEAGGQKAPEKNPLKNLRDEEIEKALEPIDPKRQKASKKVTRRRPKGPKATMPQLPVEDVVEEAVKLLKKRKISGGLSPSEFGTRLHSAVREVILKRTGKPPEGWIVAAEKPLRNFVSIKPENAGLTVEQYMTKYGMQPRYPNFPSKLLRTKIQDLTPDLIIKAPDGRALVWDVTSQLYAEHLAKTQLYTEIFWRESGIIQYLRISESYWRKVFL